MSEPTTHTQTQLHKTVSQSSTKWVSPFRLSSINSSSKKTVKNEANYSSYIAAGNVPAKETPKVEGTEIGDADVVEETPLVQTPVEADEELEVVEEPIEQSEVVNEAPVEEAPVKEAPADETPIAEDPIDETAVAEEPVDETPATEKPTPVAPVKKEVKPALLPVPALIRSRPKMFSRYKENFNITSSIMDKNKIENLDRRVNLGAGLVLTEEQIYELAKKKLEPLMKQIDDKVAENNARDAEKAFQVEEGIRIKDEGVVAADLAKYKAGVDSKTATVENEHNTAFKAVEDKAAKSKEDYEQYLQDQRDGIVKDKEDSEKAEDDAVAAHEKNKVELVENAEQFKIDKTKELEDSKAKQIEEADLTEKFKTNTAEAKSKQISLQSELDAKKAELEEKIKKVEALIAAKHEKKQIIRTSTKRKNVADRSYNIINSKHAHAAANVGILASQVGLLTDRVNAHSTKIDQLNTAGKEALVQKKVDATIASDDWAEHLAQVRLEEAKKQEQIRIAAEEERKRIEQEKIEEEERLAKEKKEEEARLAKQKEEEEARLAKEKEDAKIAAGKKKKEEEEEAARVAEEVERLKKLKQLNEEKLKLQSSVEVQEKEKSKSSTGVLLGAAGAAVGAVTGAATGATITGASLAGNAASGAGNVIGGIADAAAAPITQSKSIEIPSYQQELENSNVGEKKLSSNNPFYTGEFNDDLPSTIHEEEDGEDVSPKASLKDGIPKEKVVENDNDIDNDNDTITDKKVVEEPVSTTQTQPVAQQRRSMVDEAIANMTPEQISKMNAPLVPKLKKSTSKTSLNEEVKPASKSRSNSLTSKFTLKRTKSRSRNNSFKGSNPMKSATPPNSRSKVTASPSKPAISAPIAIAASAGAVTAVAATTTAIATGSPTEDVGKVDASTFSVAPSGTSETPEISQAQAIQIKTNETSPERVMSNTTQENEDDENLSDDSELPAHIGPVFTERVDDDSVVEDTAPTTAETNNPDYVEVSTLETVTSAEYHAHKDDPNYMVIN